MTNAVPCVRTLMGMPTSWADKVDPVVRDWWPVVLVLALSLIPASDAGELHPVAATLLSLLAAVPLRWRREWPATVTVAVAVPAVAYAAALRADPPFATFASLLIACLALGQYGTPIGSTALLAVVAAMGAVFVFAPPAPVANLAIPVVYFGGAWVLGRVLRRRQETAQQMTSLVAALEEERETTARLAAEAERHHIAREVHDIVAHSLGVIAIHAEAAEELLDRPSGDVRYPLGVIGDTARHALDELRGVLGTIRSDEPSPTVGIATLPHLVRRFDGAGLCVTLEMDDVEPQRRLPPAVETAAYRLVQETLTNAARHAPGATVVIALRLRRDGLHVAVRDNGARRPRGPRGTVGGGYGLAGMRERVTRLGGDFSAGAVDGGEGFYVEAHIPLAARVR